MHIRMFSERPHSYIPEDVIIENGMSYFGVPNTLFGAQKSSRLLNEYLDEAETERASPSVIPA